MSALRSGGIYVKRRITCILACVLVIATVIPTMALAASNASILDNLKLSDVKKYDAVLPTKGVKKTEKQIDDLLNKIPNKPSGKGNTSYLYSLGFVRLASKKPGNYESATVEKQWFKENDKTISIYVENRDLMNLKAGIHCEIQKMDTININIYYWVKGKKTGNHDVYENKIYNYANNTGNSTNIKTAEYLNYKLYPDATVLGEKCMVFSYEYKNLYGTFTRYYFVSRKTGQYIKNIDAGSDSIYTWIAFERKLVNKADSFFDPPKDVKFTTTIY